MPLCKSYKIIYIELGPKYSNDICLQLTIKAINDTIGPNGLVPTLLVFGAYPRIIDELSSMLVLKRAQAIKSIIKEL